MRVKSPHPQASETFERPERHFRGLLRSPILKPRGKTPGNLRFTALLVKGQYEVGKPTGAGEGIRTLDPNLGKVRGKGSNPWLSAAAIQLLRSQRFCGEDGERRPSFSGGNSRMEQAAWFEDGFRLAPS